MSRGSTALALCAALACDSRSLARSASRTTIETCAYSVTLLGVGRANVIAHCKASAELTFRASFSALRPHIRSATAGKAGRYRSQNGTLHYSVDLAALAKQSENFDAAQRVGDSYIAALSSVLLVPEPLTTEIPVTVALRPEGGLSSATGLLRDTAPETYRIMAHEIPVATYVAFGKLQQRRLEVAGSQLELAKLDGKLDRSFDELSAWVGKSAQAVSAFYGTFPVPRASVMVIPAAGREGVVFGKVLPESGPAIALVVGEHATRHALYSDWILVHELFHLGFPSFFEEGKWLDEGLATYFEPIIRVRAGLYTEGEMWTELAKSLPQGLPAYTEYGLESARDFRGIYWGGALACLEADVAARKRKLEHGLELGLRALREAGGVASEVWSVKDAISTIDQALGAPTLARVAARHAERGHAFDLEALLRDLGVLRLPDGSVQLSNDAPLAGVRRAIIEVR
ncbi:MAG TPA: hypothetical protein VEX18_10590 [Polyangiaceae bacterium]|nr:hypothetical protein [Polyangiaceae bacterium]